MAESGAPLFITAIQFLFWSWTVNGKAFGFPEALFLLLLAALLYLPGITELGPLDRDESRFAQASKQMLETGDPITIRFQDEYRLKKPAGIYWLQAGTAWLADKVVPGAEKSIWPYRIPSVLGAAAAVLLTAAIGGALFGRRAGIMGAGLFGATLLMVSDAHQAKTDAVLLATILIAQLVLARRYIAGREAFMDGPLTDRRPGLGEVTAFWLALGAGILIKGPIGPMIVALTVITLILWDRKVGWLTGMRPLYGIFLLLIVVGPWLWAILVVTDGAFLTESVGRDLLGKVAEGQEAHGGPPGLYLVLLPLTFWPASMLLWPGLAHAVAERASPSVRFCIAWILPSWLLFELVPTKLPHYVLPLYPALALLAAQAALAASLGRWPVRLADPRHPVQRIAVCLWLVLSMALGAGLVVLPRLYGSGLALLPAAAGVLVILAALVTAVLLWRARVMAAIGAGIVTSVLLVLSLGQVVAPLVDRLFPAREAAALIAEAAPGAEIFSAGFHEPSLVFLVGTDIRLVGPEAAASGLAKAADENRPAAALIERREQKAFFAAARADRLSLKVLGEVDGFNYAKGREITLVLYAASRYPDPAGTSQ